MNDTKANATTLPAVSAVPSVHLPQVRRLTVDGASCVAVELTGKRGAGREMLLDLSTWLRISEDVTPWWGLQVISGYECVTSTTKAALAAAGITSGMAFMSRLVAEPAPAMIVSFKNKNRLDIRKSNLIVGTRNELAACARGAGRKNNGARAAEVRAAVVAANAALRAA